LEPNKSLRACIVAESSLDISAILKLLESYDIGLEVFSIRDEALGRQSEKPFDLLVVQNNLTTGDGLRLIRDFLAVNWMTASIVICDVDEDTIHERAEGLGILGHIRSVGDVQSFGQLLDTFKQMASSAVIVFPLMLMHDS
jgi:hypothetical protein